MSKTKHPGCPMLPRGEYPDSKEYCERNCKRTRCWGCPKIGEYGLTLQDRSEVERNIKEMEEGLKKWRKGSDLPQLQIKRNI